MNQFCPSPNELTAPPASGHSGQLTNSSSVLGKVPACSACSSMPD
jgi:hypothetical protein